MLLVLVIILHTDLKGFLNKIWIQILLICKKLWQIINLAPLPDSYLSLYRANGLDELIGFIK
ncbi:hypothetical protein NO098_280063 [Flavobacterium psychrophilum]|nr:hypothetical protein FI070_320152 [Flavobacterium psychrophilum]SNB36225.1 hypothetical protein NO098_280063 [Flavobacterium psychrophilum]